MGRTLVSQFLNLSNACPRFTSYGTSTKLQRRLPMIDKNYLPVVGSVNSHRCYCSVSTPEPAVSETSSTSVKKRIVSGVQPTGSIHLGNYLGAIKNWVSLQDKYETLFFIVDLHAITLPYDVQQLSKATRDTAALYLACGIDTSKASVFVQSHVRAHVELMWLLSSATPIGWLNRMIQFKEKSRKAGDENVGVALLTYPVLMASDILLYQSDLVPVGEDQKQHLELTRELAERVNHLYGGRKWKKLGGRGGSIFKVPEPLIPPAGARVMSLTDGLSKKKDKGGVRPTRGKLYILSRTKKNGSIVNADAAKVIDDIKVIAGDTSTSTSSTNTGIVDWSNDDLARVKGKEKGDYTRCAGPKIRIPKSKRSRVSQVPMLKARINELEDEVKEMKENQAVILQFMANYKNQNPNGEFSNVLNSTKTEVANDSSSVDNHGPCGNSITSGASKNIKSAKAITSPITHISSEQMQQRRKFLKENGELKKLYVQSVMGGLLSENEFWSIRKVQKIVKERVGLKSGTPSVIKSSSHCGQGFCV